MMNRSLLYAKGDQMSRCRCLGAQCSPYDGGNRSRPTSRRRNTNQGGKCPL